MLFLWKDVFLGYNKISTNIAYSFPNQITLKNWSFSVRNLGFREYLESQGVNGVDLAFNSKNDPQETYKISKSLIDKYSINIYSVGKFEREIIEDFDLKIEEDGDNQYLVKNTYIINGQAQQKIFSQDYVEFTDKDLTEEKILSTKLTNEISPKTEKVFNGSLSEADFKSEFKNYLTEIQQENPIQLEVFKFNHKEEIRIEDIKDSFIVGQIQVLYPKCSYFIESNFIFDLIDNRYELEDDIDFNKYDCKEPQSYPEPVELQTCEDCSLARVDKTHRLLPSYSPNTVKVEVGEEVYIIEEANQDLLNLFNDLKAQGFEPNVTSSYRSYESQEEVFEYWVERDMRLFGTPKAEAEVRANTYSARPGFSEHQLGTTVDLNSIKCEGFDGYCQANEDMWAWLSKNAHKYGFALSYLKDRQNDTGYIFEPWHYRWLGKDLALEYKAQEGGLTLNKWLDKL